MVGACAADIEIQANEILHHKLTLNGYLAEFTGQSMERITQVHLHCHPMPPSSLPSFAQFLSWLSLAGQMSGKSLHAATLLRQECLVVSPAS